VGSAKAGVGKLLGVRGTARLDFLQLLQARRCRPVGSCTLCRATQTRHQIYVGAAGIVVT